MPIEAFGEGGFVATGRGIDYVQLVSLRGRLRLEIVGIRFRGRPTSEILRQKFGWRERSRAALLKKLDAEILRFKE